MSTNKQAFTGKKRSHPEDISENDYNKSEEIRNKYNQNYNRRSYQNQSLNITQNQPSKRYENIKDQKGIQNNNNFYKKSGYQNATVKAKQDDNYTVSPSRSPSIRESNYNAISPQLSDHYDDAQNNYGVNNSRKFQNIEPANIPIGFPINIQFDSVNEGNIRNQPRKREMPEIQSMRKDSRDFNDKNFYRDNQQRNSKNHGSSSDQYGHSRNKYEHDAKYQNIDSTRHHNNDNSPRNNDRFIRAEKEGNRNSRRPDDYHNKSSHHHNQQQKYNSHSDRERDRNYNQKSTRQR